MPGILACSPTSIWPIRTLTRIPAETSLQTVVVARSSMPGHIARLQAWPAPKCDATCEANISIQWCALSESLSAPFFSPALILIDSVAIRRLVTDNSTSTAIRYLAQWDHVPSRDLSKHLLTEPNCPWRGLSKLDRSLRGLVFDKEDNALTGLPSADTSSTVRRIAATSSWINAARLGTLD